MMRPTGARIQRVQRVQRGRWTGPLTPRVLKVLRFDGPAARGLWIAACGNNYIVSVTGLPSCYIYQAKHFAELATPVANPYPAAPDLPKGGAADTKEARLERFSAVFGGQKPRQTCHAVAPIKRGCEKM